VNHRRKKRSSPNRKRKKKFHHQPPSQQAQKSKAASLIQKVGDTKASTREEMSDGAVCALLGPPHRSGHREKP
jgi:hypothetical protein